MTSNQRFRKLLEPGYIGSVRTRNRILKTGANPGEFEYIGGYVQDGFKDYYESMAQGGAGIVTMGAADIDYPFALLANTGYRIDDDKYISSLNEAVQRIHKYDCPAFIQMFHTGPMHPSRISGQQPVAASAIPKSQSPKPQFDVARELSSSEVEAITEKFISAAVRAKKAEFDGIELNAGCNHLLNSFLSPAWNQRHDIYGCDSRENRTRMIVNIIQGIKSRNGKDFAIIALFNAAEPGLEKGITLEEGQEIAKLLQAAGADAIHARIEYYFKYYSGLQDSTHFPEVLCYPEPKVSSKAEINCRQHGKGGWVPAAAGIKKVVSIPVIAVGRLDPVLGEKILRQGKADFISLNRRLMADHELPNKVAANKLEDIAPCNGCLTCFEAVETFVEPPKCRINAAIGREREYEIKPAGQRKTIMIAGGGPAGLEAARICALRGHKVILVEKESRLGGSLPVAGVVKGFEREDLTSTVAYLSTQVHKLGVDVRLGQEVNASVINEIKPDVLILATGGQHDMPQIPGINCGSVIQSKYLHSLLKKYLRFFSPRIMRWLTKLWMPVGKTVVIIAGGIHGCQTAEFLVKRGRKVTIVDTGKDIGNGLVEIFSKPLLLDWLKAKGVKILAGVKYEEITDKGLRLTTADGHIITLEADTIMTALPMKADAEIVDKFRGLAPEIYSIGDCRLPGLIIDAIADGSRIARMT